MRNIITTHTSAILATCLVLISLQSEAKDTRGNSSHSSVSPNSICPEDPLLMNGDFSTRLLDECGGDPGGGGGDPGGGTSPPPPAPFSPPFMASPTEILPLPFSNPIYYSVCNQFPHPFTAFSNDVAQGTTLYLSGIVAPGTQAVFGFYTPTGQLADIQITNASKSNCVIHHDENPFDTNGLAPGYYTVYASYIALGAPYGLQCFYGTIPPNFNYNIVTPGYHCPMPMQYVTTIRIR
jgi:hypothetical protein